MIVYQFNKKQNKVQDDIKSDIQKFSLILSTLIYYLILNYKEKILIL